MSLVDQISLRFRVNELENRIKSLTNQHLELSQTREEYVHEKTDVSNFIKKYTDKLTVQSKMNIAKILSEIDENIHYADLFIEDVDHDLKTAFADLAGCLQPLT